jgi:pimeloyl-ACP methyl ester carboxylesterase
MRSPMRAQGPLPEQGPIAKAILQAIAVETITAPTLVASLEDDFYRTRAPARAIAAAVPGARLLTYATGGHAFIGREADLFAEVEAFIKQHQPSETTAAR